MITRLLALLFAVVVAVPAESQQQPPGSAQRQSQARVPAQVQEVPPPPVSLNVSVSPTVITGSPNESQQPSNDGTRADWEMVFWTKAATIIGFALLVIAFFQFRSQNDQTREALRLAAEANDTAKQAREDATKATADTLKVAERQLYMTLRARMGLTQIEAVDFKANTQALIRFYFRNFGGKGGFIEDYCVYSPPVGDPLPPTPDYPASEWRESGVPVEAGDVYELMVDINAVPDVAWNMITDETRNVRLVFIGQIRYRVGFGKDVLRIGFCREYDPKLSRLAKQPIFKNVGGKAYNYAD